MPFAKLAELRLRPGPGHVRPAEAVMHVVDPTEVRLDLMSEAAYGACRVLVEVQSDVVAARHVP